MTRLLRLLLALAVTTPTLAAAARTEVAVPGMPSQSRFAWDSTTRKFIIEIEGKDALAIGRDQMDVMVSRADASVIEHFSEGAAGKGLYTIQSDGTVTDGATGVQNVLYTGSGNRFMFASLGAGQTILPVMAAGGLDISGDATDDEGYEISTGWLGASGRPFIIGTDPAFQFCADVTFTDISDTDDWHMGFRKLELTNAAFNDYTDYATIGTIGEANPATIFIETALNNAGDASTDTTQTVADATEVKWCVKVSAAGVVTYTHNGAAPTVTAAFTFDDGDMVIPFIWSLHGTSSSMGAVIGRWDVGFQELD
jgi:hypothetical protein